jgi:hypothetical protein
MFAGNVIATVKLEGAIKFLTIRPAAFTHPEKGTDPSSVESIHIEAEKLPSFIEYESCEAKASGRPPCPLRQTCDRGLTNRRQRRTGAGKLACIRPSGLRI